MKTYVVGTHEKCLKEALLMSTHMFGKIRKIFSWFFSYMELLSEYYGLLHYFIYLSWQTVEKSMYSLSEQQRLTHFSLETPKRVNGKSADPDQMPQNLGSDQGIHCLLSQPRWLSWMRRPTGDQEVAGSTPAEVGNILSWRLIVKYFLRSFSPFRWFKKGGCQFLAKECAQYLLTT